MQVFVGRMSGPKVWLVDLPAGTVKVNEGTKVSDASEQLFPNGPLKTILTVRACELAVQLVTAAVILKMKILPGVKLEGLMLFSAYRQERE